MKRILQLIREAWALETGSLPGRINLGGMLLGLIASGLLSITSFFEAVVRVFQPAYTSHFPTLQLFIAYLVFNLGCVALLVWLERSGRAQR